MIGRFPIYIHQCYTDHEERWQYILKIIKDLDEAVYQFLLSAPDGTLRVVGPFNTKRGSCMVLSTPLPALFRFLVLNLPTKVKTVVKQDKAFVELSTTKQLFKRPATYVLKIKDADEISFRQLIHDFGMFLGLKIQPIFLFDSVKVSGSYTFITLKALNKDASAMVNFSRYSGIGNNRKYGFGDVEIFTLEQ